MKTRELLYLASYFYNNYPNINGKVKFWQLLSLLDRNEDKIVFVRRNEEFESVGFYLKLSDENFIELILGKYDFRNPEHLNFLLKDNGKNIHFIGCVARNMKGILKGLKKMIEYENPTTVSWFKPSMDKLHIIKFERKGKLCHQ